MITATLYVEDNPRNAAAILRERAMLQLRGEVYVLPHVRRWPGGLFKARHSKRHTTISLIRRNHA